MLFCMINTYIYIYLLYYSSMQLVSNIISYRYMTGPHTFVNKTKQDSPRGQCGQMRECRNRSVAACMSKNQTEASQAAWHPPPRRCKTCTSSTLCLRIPDFPIGRSNFQSSWRAVIRGLLQSHSRSSVPWSLDAESELTAPLLHLWGFFDDFTTWQLTW